MNHGNMLDFIELDLQKRLFGAGGCFELKVHLSIPKNAIVALTGPSGAGKTTLLRLLAGLDRPDAGTIKVQGKTWFDQAIGIHLPPQKREIGFVFQNYALFPTMSVRKNLSYAAANRNFPQIERLLKMMGLEEFRDRLPHQLSGGQQQRVALARALVRRPKILLLDEPLSALDPVMRARLQKEILMLQRELDLTVLLVSHDQNEIQRLASTVLRIDQGRIQNLGRPPACVAGKTVRVSWTGAAWSLLVEAGANMIETTFDEETLRRAQASYTCRSDGRLFHYHENDGGKKAQDQCQHHCPFEFAAKDCVVNFK